MSDGGKRAGLLVAGTVLAVTTGWLSYIGTGRQDVLLGVVVGFQAEILVLLLEVLLTVMRREAAIGRAARLVRRIEEMPGLARRLDEVTDHLAAIDERYSGTVLPEEAGRLLDRFQSHLHELRHGHLYNKTYDVSLKMELLSRPRGTLRTTSLQSPDLELHLSEVGRAYWQAQVNALRRGWTIERTFVYDEWTDELDDLARRQAAVGVVVRRIARRNVPTNLREDFSIWSDEYSYQQWARRPNGIFEDRFSAAPEDLSRCRSMWTRLVALAERFPVPVTEPAEGTPGPRPTSPPSPRVP